MKIRRMKLSIECKLLTFCSHSAATWIYLFFHFRRRRVHVDYITDWVFSYTITFFYILASFSLTVFILVLLLPRFALFYYYFFASFSYFYLWPLIVVMFVAFLTKKDEKIKKIYTSEKYEGMLERSNGWKINGYYGSVLSMSKM